MHSFLAKGRLLYTHDRTIADLCATAAEHRRPRHARSSCCARRLARCRRSTRRTSGSSPAAISTTPRCGSSTPPTPLAQIEVIGAGLLADREVIPQAHEAEPGVLPDDLHRPAQRAERRTASVKAALDAVDGYIARARRDLFAPVLDHLREVGEARSCTEIDDHFKRNFGIGDVTDRLRVPRRPGLIGKASRPSG